jgi:hypothetical protein
VPPPEAPRPAIPLTPAPEAEAQHLFDLLREAFLGEAQNLARLLARKGDRQLLGRTEFAVPDAVHRLGAQALEAARNGRKNGGTRGRA